MHCGYQGSKNHSIIETKEPLPNDPPNHKSLYYSIFTKRPPQLETNLAGQKRDMAKVMSFRPLERWLRPSREPAVAPRCCGL